MTHRIWIAFSGDAKPATIAINIVKISPRFDDNRKNTDFLILLYIFLPSSMAFSIVAKLSSVSTMSAAPFATSVPVIPIATPISAVFREGASLTPSPVIETICPWDLKALTIITLFSGDTLAKTRRLGAAAFSSSWVIWLN